MHEEVLIVDHVSKKFSRSLKRAMIYGLVEVGQAAIAPHREGMAVSNQLRETEFWALKDVSFSLRRGECLGLIGNNGAGKSTLLSILSGIYNPTQGRVEVKGRLQALIALGAGFHPMLTGRENIFIYGLVLGLKKAEIRATLDEIIAFSELEEFIDMPVKNYSSGMYVRLGFAVAAHMNPDILLIDEVLAVGDMGFQKKCIDKINTLMSEDRAIILVTHSLYRIESLCQQCVWLEHGNVVEKGPARDIVRRYREHEAAVSSSTVMPEGKMLTSSPFFDIEKLELLHLDGKKGNPFSYGEPVRLRLYFNAKKRIERPSFNIPFCSEGVRIFEASMLIDGDVPAYLEGRGMVECLIKNQRLLPKVYDIELYVRSKEGVADLIDIQKIGELVISSDGIEQIPQKGPYAIGLIMQGGLVYYEYEWNLEKARDEH